jgi:hypothetical protein
VLREKVIFDVNKFASRIDPFKRVIVTLRANF